MFSSDANIDKGLNFARKAIPKPVFKFFQPIYHWLLAMLATFIYGYPSRAMKVIGVTGTKGKSTTVYMIHKIFRDQGKSIAMIGSLGYKINDRSWPNTLKMTMPGRFKLQKFLYESKKAGCEYVILEVTSEGMAQKRLTGIKVDCAVFTNLHKEHIESHGSFEDYKEAKMKLFHKTKNIHILNTENIHWQEFHEIPSRKKITFGLKTGDITQSILGLKLILSGEFNIFNALGSIAAAHAYGLDFLKAKESVEKIESIPGRMEFIEKGQPFEVVVDYAHTPESLEYVYQTLKPISGKMICVLGAAGGGRDSWKRPVFGEIAENYCDKIILTNEDPYDEDPLKIIKDIQVGIKIQEKIDRTSVIADRGKAIYEAIDQADKGDVVVITGKGSEMTMTMAGNKQIHWSDSETVKEILKMKISENARNKI